MNKKIFTLLAGSLMLFMAVFSTNAQGAYFTGDTVKYLPQGVGKGAYHLMLTYRGHSNPTDRTASSVGDNKNILAMDSTGYVYLTDSATIIKMYENLREAMWCVNVQQENLGQVPTYTFTNKQWSMDFAVSDDKGTFPDSAHLAKSLSPIAKFGSVLKQTIYGTSGLGGKYAQHQVYSSGDLTNWWFSRTYNTSPLETDQFLRIEIASEPDFYLTLAVPTSAGDKDGSLMLVKAHKNDFNPGAPFYENNLAFFTLVNAAPRVLTARDFNTKLYETSKEGYVTLAWDRNVSADQVNVFAQPLKATDADNKNGKADHYLYLHNEKTNYLYVSQDYYNELGSIYPVIKDDAAAKGNADNTDKFRLVYYPTEDSLVINVHSIKDHPVHGSQSDNGRYDQGHDNLYNWDIWRYLIVRMQDLDGKLKKTVITVADEPANTRVSFGIRDCQVVDTDRTTLEPDLYTVRDSRGRYLGVPLVAGDFTPQWINMNVDSYGGASDTIEKVLKTPSYQWFITKVKEKDESNTSRVYLVNREFDFIRLEYVQVYKSPHKFYATWTFLSDSLNPNATYIVDGTAEVSVDGYQVVRDDSRAAAKKDELVKLHGTKLTGSTSHQVEAWMEYMPQDLMEKLYRTGPFLGYKAILPDTLNYYGYSFNFLHKASNDWYFGVTEATNKDNKDTTLYIAKDRTFFELTLPDSLRADGREKYGVGHDGAYQKYERTKDIAPLERYYYHFMINDYYKFDWNDNYLVLEDNQRYVYTDEAEANARKLNKAKFYMRFTYEKNATEYYTLIDRIDKSNFEYLTKVMGMAITDTLKSFDDSHGGITNKSFGVVTAYVDDLNNYIKAAVKTLAGTVSTFSLGQMQDELYRRFNTGLEECGRGEEGDEPRTLKFYRYNNVHDFVYEDSHGPNSVPGSGIRFMGIESDADCDVSNGQWHKDHNYAIYVDTAYVNRGTGHIKPQYMLVVNPQIEQGGIGCNECGDSIDFRPYVYGRYLRNETDSARVGGVPKGVVLNKYYLWEGWERLAFTEAIHVGDSLYILNGTPITALYSKDKDGKQYLNFARVVLFPNIKIVDLGNNFHKDEVFSMRFVEPQRDKLGNKIEGASKRFLMENETTNRDWTKGRMIAPVQGGWVKRQNFVPVISRGSFKDAINEAEVWEVKCASVNEDPTAIDEIAADNVTVVSGSGNVSILNAAGKKAIVSNVLGQTIAQEVLTSDNVTIQAPKGVVVVAIEGHNAVKTVVK
ncbi:MAG: DUF6383 domain-containing protein [Tannerella sp.]|jgi:hypothetical protein|nr:DUF6383 domain-containing protein [Tannerella sp.]